MANFAYYVLESLSKNPQKKCLVLGKEEVNCEEFHKKVTVYAKLLRAKGVRPKDYLLLTILPSVDFFALSVAAFAVGAALVLVNIKMELRKINHCIALARPSVWVWAKGSWFKWLHLLVPALRQVPLKIELGDTSLYHPVGGADTYLSPLEAESVDHALVTFTTGSTGLPKLLLRKHEFLLNQSKALNIAKLQINEAWKLEDVTAFTNLATFLLDSLKVGSTGLLQQNTPSLNAADVIAMATDNNVAVFGGSPAFAEKIAQYCVENGRQIPSEYILVGGAPVYSRMLQVLCRAAPSPEKVIVVYGSTEAEPVSFIRAADKLKVEEGSSVGMCVGRPVFEGSVKVVRVEEGVSGRVLESVEAPLGETGELVLSGWHVNTYQVDSNHILCDSFGKKWLRSEDAGYLDNQGRIWLVGRVKWMVERGGKRFWSYVVEEKGLIVVLADTDSDTTAYKMRSVVRGGYFYIVKMVLGCCSSATFAAYLPHEGRAWLFVEAPKGQLGSGESAALHNLLEREGIPVDELRVVAYIKRDQRHASKPDTAALFKTTSVAQRVWKATDALLLILGGSTAALGVVVAIFLALLLYALT